MYIAAKKNHAKCIETLVRSGANVNRANKKGLTPVYIAAKEKSAEALQVCH